MAKLKIGDKYVLKEGKGLLKSGETVVVRESQELIGPGKDQYWVKIESVSRPTYEAWDAIRLGKEPEIVGGAANG